MTKKLLLADDSITIQKVIGIIFATEDYQLLMSDDGNDAFEKAREEHPDLVIADVSMPGKDGFELCQAIKSEPQLAHTSVLLLPGTFDHFDEGRAEAVGADGWITKPFESQALLDKVAQLLEAEPVSLSDVEAAPIAEVAEPAIEAVDVPVAEETGEAVDEDVLGLNEVEEPVVADTVEEESPDDIWDAVSFEEEDLQQSAALPAEDESTVEDVSVSEAPEVFEPDTDEVAFDSEGEAAAEELLTEVEPEQNADEPVDFSAGEGFEIAEDADSGFVLETDEEELLELTEEVAEEESFAQPSALEDEAIDDVPLELTEEVAEEQDLEQPMELEEDSSLLEAAVEELEPVVEQEIEELPIVEPLEEDSLGEDEEILDLAEDDILDEELVEEVAPVADFTPESFVEPVAEEEPFALEDEPEAVAEFATAAPLEDTVDEPVFEQPGLEEEVAEEEPREEPVAEIEPEVELEPEATEDEGFYYDASEAEEETYVAPAAALAAGVAVAAVASSSTVEQAEQQLRELSDDELKEVVAKVAGPTIEKLANEMLEQIVWEVVPDLAESMIREEIRKIRQGAE